METLYDDLIIIITNKLSDKEKIYMSTLSKRFDRLKFKNIYVELVFISEVKLLSYFDNFENISLDTGYYYDGYSCDDDNDDYSYDDNNDNDITYPKCVKFIHYSTINLNIPQKVTHVTFNKRFNRPINKCIPSSVTHLTFGRNFNQPINNCIPSSVICLTFGCYFNQQINNCIPFSVTHLTFDHYFNQPINNCIPSSVTHLTFGYHFNQPINNCIPSSVTRLIFGDKFNQPIQEIPCSVKKITIRKDYNSEIDEKIKLHAEIEKEPW
jgi:hypothetical protein